MQNKPTLSLSFKTLAALAIALGLSACSAQEKLDDMHNLTRKMSDTTTGMSQQTGQLKLLSGTMFRGMRKGSTADMRIKFLRELNDGSDYKTKLSQASKYFFGYEFQGWHYISDKLSEREILMDQALDEFFRETPEKISANRKVKLFPIVGSNEALNAAAIGTTMHQIDPLQTEMVRDAQVDSNLSSETKNLIHEVSIYSSIESALKRIQQHENGEIAFGDLTTSERIVYHWKEDAIYILQMRHNGILLMVMANLNGLADESTMIGKLALIFHDKHMSWKSNYSKLNLGQLTDYKDYLEGARDTQDLLLSLGKNVEVDSDLAKIIGNMDSSGTLGLPSLQGDIKTTAEEVDSLMKALARSKKPIPTLPSGS
jgi:hypothetical protein